MDRSVNLWVTVLQFCKPFINKSKKFLWCFVFVSFSFSLLFFWGFFLLLLFLFGGHILQCFKVMHSGITPVRTWSIKSRQLSARQRYIHPQEYEIFCFTDWSMWYTYFYFLVNLIICYIPRNIFLQWHVIVVLHTYFYSPVSLLKFYVCTH